MKPYRFRLQSVLEYRCEQLNLIQQKVAEAEKVRLEIVKRIQEYDQAIEQAFQDQQRRVGEAVLDVMQAQNFPNYIWRLKQQRFQEYQRLKQQEHIIAGIREQLKAAQIKKKSLEVLKEKDFDRYKKRLEKAEEEFLSEIALNRLRQPHPLHS